MAEYYTVLKRAVDSLDAGSAESRRAVYDKARNALIGQLKAIDPPLAASEISRQRLELEEAIRRVEREIANAAASRRPQGTEPVQATEPEAAPPAVPQPQAHSPQDVFRRAIHDAESRGTALKRASERHAARNGGQSGAPALQQGNAGPGARPAANQPLVRPGYPEEGYLPEPAIAAAPVEPAYEEPWVARQPTVAVAPPNPYPEERGRSKHSVSPRRDYRDEDDAEIVRAEARRSRIPTILLVLLIVGMLGGLGALAWSQRAIIGDILAGFDQGGSEAPAPVSEDVARVAPSAPDTPAPPDAGATAPDAIAQAITTAPETAGEALVGQRAVLYEEPLDAATAAAGVTAIDAAVTWRFNEGGANGPEVEANLHVPQRGLQIRLSIRRNDDSTLPASHLVEAIVNTPPEFPGGGIRGIPRLVLKASEDERGEPLVGAAAKVADGFFWIALSATDTDIAQNLRLLRDRSWIDLPIVYESGQRAILTFEKGTPGERAFERAFAAWATG